jgi:hypothetical protein
MYLSAASKASSSSCVVLFGAIELMRSIALSLRIPVGLPSAAPSVQTVHQYNVMDVSCNEMSCVSHEAQYKVIIVLCSVNLGSYNTDLM